MANISDIFLSYSQNDHTAAINLRSQLERRGLSVFRDIDKTREGELWIARLQEEISGCRSFIILVGQDGVERWVKAEVQVALSRHFHPRDDSKRLPIYPILLDHVEPESLPLFLQLFLSSRWNGVDQLAESLLDQIARRVLLSPATKDFSGCPFVGLEAFRADQAHLFFGRQKETLDALECISTRYGVPTCKWLEINGDSGCGKSSLVRAGLIPLIKQGWLWPRTGFEHWHLIGPMMPGANPIEMLSEQLAQSFGVEMTELRHLLEDNLDDRILAEWLRTRKKPETAFLLVIDQFEEFFTIADSTGNERFDRLLARALEDAECPLFVISTARGDFLHRFEMLPKLAAVRNRFCRPWTLLPIGPEGLRDIIAGRARLANLDVSQVQEAIIGQAMVESGALPLVENALKWLWERRIENRLSGKELTDCNGIGGILIQSADELLNSMGAERQQALGLLHELVQTDQEGHRHTRRPLSYREAVNAAGGGQRGQTILNRLSGERSLEAPGAPRTLRLVTVSKENRKNRGEADGNQWVNLIHETLILAGRDENGVPKPYWPTLWNYIEQNKAKAARRDRIRLSAREWNQRRGFSRNFGLAGWLGIVELLSVKERDDIEQRYMRWSMGRTVTVTLMLVTIVGLIGNIAYWAIAHSYGFDAVLKRWKFMTGHYLPKPETKPIPPGTFTMGRWNDWEPHDVTIAQSYNMTRTEITFEQYDIFAISTGRSLPRDGGWGRGDRPVVTVTWDDAAAYAVWLGRTLANECRLPSEAEWERACWGDSLDNRNLPAEQQGQDMIGKGRANCRDCTNPPNTPDRTLPVKSFDANSYGLYDMRGNVWEWVQDCWHEKSAGAPLNGTAWGASGNASCIEPVVRGGAWVFGHAASSCSARYNHTHTLEDNYTGFRVVCSSPIQ